MLNIKYMTFLCVLLLFTVFVIGCGSDDGGQNAHGKPIVPAKKIKNSCQLSWHAHITLQQNGLGFSSGIVSWDAPPVVDNPTDKCLVKSIQYQVSNPSQTIYNVASADSLAMKIPVVIQYCPNESVKHNLLSVKATVNFSDDVQSSVTKTVDLPLTQPPVVPILPTDYAKRIDVFTGEVMGDGNGNKYCVTGNSVKNFYPVPIIHDDLGSSYPATRDKDTPIPFAHAEHVVIAGKKYTQYPNDGYGRYVACNDEEMSYMQVPHFDVALSQKFCSTNGSTDYQANMKKYLSATCYQKFDQLINEFKHSVPGESVCSSGSVSSDWLHYIDVCKAGETKNCGKILRYNDDNKLYFSYPFGSYPGDNYYPYRHSQDYYPVSDQLSDLIEYQLTNFKVDVDSNPDHQRRIDWAFPKYGCDALHGCPVVVIFPGGGNQDMDGMYYRYQDEVPNAKSVTAAQAPFTDSWDWPESAGNPWARPEPISAYDVYSYGYYVRMQLLRALLKKGYAVIFVNPLSDKKTDWDDWSFCPSTSHVDSCGVPWPGNDRDFLTVFFKSLISGDFKSLSGSAHLPAKIDLNNLFLIGYSSGSQMVSRMINEFANPKSSYWLPTIDGNLQHFSQDNLLKIKGAVLLSGGSYYTYSDLLDTKPESSDGACLPCTHGDDSTCDAFSHDLYPLGRIFNAGGCASQKMLEDNYTPTISSVNDNPIAKNHPPVLLAQSNYDDYADRHASVFYYFLLNHLYKGMAYRISSNNSKTTHHYFPEMVIPTLNFMQKYRTYYG